jgi:tRNA(Ile2) C34 agmatinyltransferase TiaS
MYWLKACPRCNGDLHEIKDVGETYVSCIQCGRILTAVQEAELPRKPLAFQFRRPLPRKSIAA